MVARDLALQARLYQELKSSWPDMQSPMPSYKALRSLPLLVSDGSVQSPVEFHESCNADASNTILQRGTVQEGIRLTHGVATGPSRLVGKGGARVAGYDVPAKVIRLSALRNLSPLSDHQHCCRPSSQPRPTLSTWTPRCFRIPKSSNQTDGPMTTAPTRSWLSPEAAACALPNSECYISAVHTELPGHANAKPSDSVTRYSLMMLYTTLAAVFRRFRVEPYETTWVSTRSTIQPLN